MIRKLIAVVALAGGGSAAIWLGLFTDTANRVATCPVRISDEGLSLSTAQGLALKRNERLRFPVVRTLQADGGLKFDLSPNMDDLRGLVLVKDWTDCDIDTTATFPTVAARWDAGLPFVFPGATSRKCVRPKWDAGLLCRRRASDGGVWDYGDRNVFPRTDALNAADCEPSECGHFLGEDAEEAL